MMIIVKNYTFITIKQLALIIVRHAQNEVKTHSLFDLMFSFGLTMKQSLSSSKIQSSSSILVLLVLSDDGVEEDVEG
jgi:hypothetical protein